MNCKRILFFFLSPFVACGFDQTTTVTAHCATYDGNRIVLSGDVRVLNEGYQVSAQKALLVRDEERQTRFEFPWVELTEEVRAHFLEKYFLECDQVNFNYLTRHLVCTSADRIFFYEGKRKIFAEKADVDYEEINNKLVLSKITLLGNVEMHIVSEDLDEKKEQYALADRVEFFPEEEMILLKADQNKRVLFFDKVHEVTISSEMVKAQKRKGKEVIEGIGDVRFIFKEEELEKLKKQFELK